VTLRPVRPISPARLQRASGACILAFPFDLRQPLAPANKVVASGAPAGRDKFRCPGSRGIAPLASRTRAFSGAWIYAQKLPGSVCTINAVRGRFSITDRNWLRKEYASDARLRSRDVAIHNDELFRLAFPRSWTTLEVDSTPATFRLCVDAVFQRPPNSSFFAPLRLPLHVLAVVRMNLLDAEELSVLRASTENFLVRHGVIASLPCPDGDHVGGILVIRRKIPPFEQLAPHSGESAVADRPCRHRTAAQSTRPRTACRRRKTRTGLPRTASSVARTLLNASVTSRVTANAVPTATTLSSPYAGTRRKLSRSSRFLPAPLVLLWTSRLSVRLQLARPCGQHTSRLLCR